MSNGEWTVLGIFIGVLVGTSVYNTLVLNRLPKTAKWNEVKLANPYKWAFKCSNCGEIQTAGLGSDKSERLILLPALRRENGKGGIFTTVVEYINRIRHMNNELSFKQRQREELLEVLTSITAPQGEAIQKTADDKMSRLISQYVDLGEEIVELYRRKFAAETELLSLTRQLPPQWEEFVLLRYCRNMSIESIAEEMGYSCEWCWKTNRKANEALEILINSKSVQENTEKYS